MYSNKATYDRESRDVIMHYEAERLSRLLHGITKPITRIAVRCDDPEEGQQITVWTEGMQTWRTDSKFAQYDPSNKFIKEYEDIL